MARLLFTVWPYPTHLHPFIAVAWEVRRRGHEVAFYTGGEGLPLVAQEGFRSFPFGALDWAPVQRTVDDLIAGRRNPSEMRRLWPKFLAETVPAQVRDLEVVLANWPADALLCDIALWAPILILQERAGIPVVPLSHVAHCILPGPDGPLPGFALPRRRNGLQEVVAGLASLGARLVTARTRRRANQLRRQFGLAGLRTGVNEFTGTLPLYLVPSTPEFDNCRRDLPPSVRYVGPCLWEKHQGQPPPDWIAEVPGKRPLVLVDEGALFTREPRILQMAARGLAGLPLSAVLLAGHGRDPGRIPMGTLAGNVILKPHAPLSDLLPLADALVTNGNSESVLAGLLAGRPVVVLPSIWDQAEMAWRVQETGTGLRLSPRRATPQDLRVAVQRVLHEPAFRQNAAAMGARLAAQGGPARASDLIEELVCPARLAGRPGQP
jgi:MGT family glycosyltransferase